MTLFKDARVIEHLISRCASVHVFKLHTVRLETLLWFCVGRRDGAGGVQRVGGGRWPGNKFCVETWARFRHFFTASAALLWGFLSETEEGEAGVKKREKRVSGNAWVTGWITEWDDWVKKQASVQRDWWYWLQRHSPFSLQNRAEEEILKHQSKSSCCRHVCMDTCTQGLVVTEYLVLFKITKYLYLKVKYLYLYCKKKSIYYLL